MGESRRPAHQFGDLVRLGPPGHTSLRQRAHSVFLLKLGSGTVGRPP
jgi:hypothetical protein